MLSYIRLVQQVRMIPLWGVSGHRVVGAEGVWLRDLASPSRLTGKTSLLSNSVIPHVIQAGTDKF